MPTTEQLRYRSEKLFSRLLSAQEAPARREVAPAAAAARAAAPAVKPFSWFDPEQAVDAAALSFRLSALAASKDDVDEGLGSALDHVEEEMERAHPEEVRQGFALFVTHNQDGRRLAKPRTVAAAPGLFTAAPAEDVDLAVSIGGLSPELDYWREDPLANEHHQHWHEVYPYPGLPPRRFDEWLAQRSQEELVAILNALQPNPGWADFVASSTPADLAELFGRVARARAVRNLPANLYSLLFRLNDRQGELFFYMHEQMLARYDAELLSNGLARVEPFGPSAWDDPIAAGQDPVGLPDFSRRDPDQTLRPEDRDQLEALRREIDDALQSKRLLAPGGTVPIDRTNIGEAVEATVRQLRALDPRAYRGIHNRGHGAIADLSVGSGEDPPRPGVMASTVTAIRDQMFWQWHKFIDDLNARWQETLPPYDFADAPDVLIRNGLDADDGTPWSSPDVILCRTADLPAGTDFAQLGEQLFGGSNWSRDFTSAEASAGGTTLTTLGELTTTMDTVDLGGSPVHFLTHEPFSYFFRIENRAAGDLDVTVRVFLVPADQAEDRRAWMEMDKFLLTLPGGSKVVAYRPDTESSIVKRPSETSPAAALGDGGGPDENTYCDCGWPYTLLLPRGTSEGMAFRLLAICTDAGVDRVPAPEHCGSMSYCGAVDRYPDTRDMGYPFSRPFGPGASAIRDRIVQLRSAAARTVTIWHV